MYGDNISPSLTEPFHVPHRPVNHQMNIQWHGRNGADRLNHRQADGDIRDKQTVHYIHMKVVRAADSVNIPL